MNPNLLNPKKYPWWGLLPLGILAVHGIRTVLYLKTEYLLYVCYTANLLLGTGILSRTPMLIGAGFGWMVIAFPLWLYDSFIHSDWETVCILFHVCGLLVGIPALRHYRMPGHTWIFAMTIALMLQAFSRIYTDEILNVNAAFRIHDGWEGVFSDYRVYWVTMVSGFSLFFIFLTRFSNHFFYVQETPNEGN